MSECVYTLFGSWLHRCKKLNYVVLQNKIIWIITDKYQIQVHFIQLDASCATDGCFIFAIFYSCNNSTKAQPILKPTEWNINWAVIGPVHLDAHEAYQYPSLSTVLRSRCSLTMATISRLTSPTQYLLRRGYTNSSTIRFFKSTPAYSGLEHGGSLIGTRWVMMGEAGMKKDVYAERLSKLLQVPHISMRSLVQQHRDIRSSPHQQVL